VAFFVKINEIKGADMSSVNLILIAEASKDIISAFETETFDFMSKNGKEALKDTNNWKKVFDAVALRYVRDMKKKNLDPTKRIGVDIKSLKKLQNKGNNRFLYLLQNRPEVVTYLEKQINFYNDKEFSRVSSYRGENPEEKMSSMRETPKLNKTELDIRMAAYGFREMPTPRGHGDRYHAGVAFEDKVVKALIKKEKAMGNDPTHKMIEKKIQMILPGEGATFAEKIYNYMEKNAQTGRPAKLHDINLVHEVVDSIDFEKQKFEKADFIFNDSMYEVKKVNILNRTLFCEFWKVADKKTLSRLAEIMHSEERAVMFYNNFMRKVYTNVTFKNKVIKYIRDGFKDTKLVGIVGSLNSSKSEVVIADASSLAFDFSIVEPNQQKSKESINKFVRLAVFVKLKHTNNVEVIDKYSNLKEAMINQMIAQELLLREQNV